MTAEQSAIRYQRIRAPRKHGEALVQPNPLHAEQLIAENRSRLAAESDRQVGYGGIDLATLRHQAREDILRIAQEHAQADRDVPNLTTLDGPVIMTGHQPALYHAGVWFKNFLADRIASRVQGIAINVIVDNDVAPAPSISALAGTPDDPRPASIAYDEPGPRVAWEMTHPASKETLRSFAQRVEETIRPLVADPLVTEFWPHVIREIDAGRPLGLAFSAARNQLEKSLGLTILDVPLSRLCQTPWFCQIAAAIFSNARGYRYAYNHCVHQYRETHKIRSTSHPVPDLGEDDGFVEVPFWIWTDENASRRGLWVSVSLTRLVLSDREGWQIELPHDADLAASLQALPSNGISIRPRALMTTTLLRLVASDLFVHGIGGAKYDQVTDEISRYYFGIEPPRFVTATATAQLPIESWDLSPNALRELDGRLRDAQFNPDRAIDNDMQANETWQSLLKEKSSLLAKVPNFPEKRAWHRKLEAVNSKLREQIAEPVARLRIERDEVARRLHQKQLLTSREYSLLLFPKDGLRNLLLDLAEKET